jgi:hypothetical protein
MVRTPAIATELARVIVFFMLLAAVPSIPAAEVAQTSEPAPEEVAWRPIEDHWFILEIGGAPAGWVHATVADDGARYSTESESSFKISRGAIEIAISTSSRFIETHDAVPVELEFSQNLAQQEVSTTWVFRDDDILSITKQGDREIKQELDRPKVKWLTPMGVHEYWTERREAGAEEITYRTITGETGLNPITFNHTLVGQEEYEFDGRTMPVTVWKTTNSMFPGLVSTSKFSSDGFQVYDEVNTGFGRMVTRIAARKEAMAVGGAPAPELMVSTFVKPDQPIERPMQAKTLALRLKSRDGELPALPEEGAQRVEMEDGSRAAIVTIDITSPLPAEAGDAEDQRYTQPSGIIDAGDTLIEKLSARAVEEAGEDPMARAEALRAFVYEHITAKSLDTAFASASETARMRTGDCSEHAVLLCAMLRANGLPARVASGLLYVDEFVGESGIFGWHMWTQVLIDGQWIDLDATLPVPYHAGHVLTGVSSLSDGSGIGDMAGLIVLIGNVDIEVIDVGYGATDADAN